MTPLEKEQSIYIQRLQIELAAQKTQNKNLLFQLSDFSNKVLNILLEEGWDINYILRRFSNEPTD